MRAPGDALQSVSLLLTAIRDYDGKTFPLIDTWESLGKKLTAEREYYKELDQHLSGEDTIIKRARLLLTRDEKIAYIFNTVKSTISWNGFKNWVSNGGINNAWKKRVGNSAEVNAVLYHLLVKSGIQAYPMLVSTRENGLIQPDFVDRFQINDLVTYVPTKDSTYYVLDATDHFNVYNQIPFELLNSYGLVLDKDKGNNAMFYIANKTESHELILVNADISADAKMKGSCEISSTAYDRSGDLELFKKESDEKYKQFLAGYNNDIKISGLTVENMQADSLPLVQKFDFTCDLNYSDKYIFFTPNIFTPLHNNPFISETRSSAIDFGYGKRHIITGNYRVPKGYVVESLPKNVNLVTPDKGIRFIRTLQKNDDDTITLRYEMQINRTIFLTSDYPNLHEFFKRMYDMLDEQIILKKS
jgi:hypothetical protein